jgi:ABC-type multidrug transport system ATPase subunit
MTYRRGARTVEVLHDVSFEVEGGELAGICAPRSAGKTTLIRVLSGALRPTQGRVLLDGVPINDSSSTQPTRPIYAAVGMATTQGPATMPQLPVREWIASSLLEGTWAQTWRLAQAALERVGAGELGDEPWADLASGERTRVAIAHAVARRPRLLLVDDLLVGLGALRGARVVALLREFASEGVTVLATTTSEIAEFGGADRIWSLSDGVLSGGRRRGAEVIPLRPSGAGSGA